MTPDQLEDVKADIYAEPWKDPQLFPDLLWKAITELGEVATGGVVIVGYDAEFDVPQLTIDCEGSPMQEWATVLLRRLRDRARTGVPFGDPDWGEFAWGDMGPTNPRDT